MEPQRKKWWTPVGLALVCAHCSLTAIAAAGAVFLGGAGWIGGAKWLAWTLPPVLILGAFFWLIRAPRECPV